MKSFKYITMSFGALALSLASCTGDFLDQVPDERTEINTQENVLQLLNASYPGANPSWLGELSSDNLIDNQAPHMPTSPNDKEILSHYNYSQYALWDVQAFSFEPATQAVYSDWDSPGVLWGEYYNSVAHVNEALAGIERIEKASGMTEKLRAARGEAKLLRAYNHFMLVNFFSRAYRGEASKEDKGVPYVTEIENVVNKHYDRGNVADVYKKIEADLEAGLADISDINFQIAPKYHFNQDAAHAFAARFYLFSHQWEKVIEHADAVLGTDTTTMKQKMMDYSIFADCSTPDDYATQWQKPELGNNLMLIVSNSVLRRRIFGSRYSCAGPAARAVLMVHDSPEGLWSGYICPAQAIVGGMILSNSTHDYGFFSAKVGEKFEYSNKIGGIGYPHVIYRAFTGNALLLERAEAKVMLGRYEEAEKDLMAYWNLGISSFSAKDYKAFIASGRTKAIKEGQIKVIYSKPNDKSHPNNFDDWKFASDMGLTVSEDARPYMNCVNDFRRFENSFEGMRFFDLKRWGMPYEHVIGLNSEVIKSTALDEKRIIEVPWESLSAGMESSRTQEKALDKVAKVSVSMNLKNLKVKGE